MNFYLAKIINWRTFVELLIKHNHDDYALVLLNKLINQKIYNFPGATWNIQSTFVEVSSLAKKSF